MDEKAIEERGLAAREGGARGDRARSATAPRWPVCWAASCAPTSTPQQHQLLHRPAVRPLGGARVPEPGPLRGLPAPGRPRACRTATTTPNTDAKAVELQGKYREHIVAMLRSRKCPRPSPEAPASTRSSAPSPGSTARRTDSVDVHKANNPWKPERVRRRSAPGLDWAALLRGRGPRGPAGDHGLASVRGHRHRRARRQGAPRRLEGLPDLPRARPGVAAAAARLRRGALPLLRHGALTGATEAARPLEAGRQRDELRARRRRREALRREVLLGRRPRRSARRWSRTSSPRSAGGSTSLEWMSPATREKAKAKVDTLYVGIGYPERWRDYSGLDDRPDDALGNAQRSELFDVPPEPRQARQARGQDRVVA